MLSLTNPVRSRAALLTALALAAAAGCSGTGSGASAPLLGSSGSASADQKTVAAVVVQSLHDLGTNDYTDLCANYAPGSSILATGIEGCTGEVQMAMMGAGDESGAETFLSEASDVTVNAAAVVVNGDSATVPKSALLYQGQPVAQYQGMQDTNLVRRNGRWYLVG